MHRYLLAFVSACIASLAIAQAQPILEQAGDFVASNFRFDDGSMLDRRTLHYVTLGTLRRDADGHVTNAVLLLHDTTGSSRTFLSAAMRRELFAPGQPLDTTRYFIVIPDAIGHGASSKPSDGLRKAFPQYDDGDAVAAQYLLVTQGLGIDHLRLVLGTTMGGSEKWLWGERHPRMMDALMPIASQPVAVAGRNGFWRQMIVTAIRRDPGWQDGRYTRSTAPVAAHDARLHADDGQPRPHQNARPTPIRPHGPTTPPSTARASTTRTTCSTGSKRRAATTRKRRLAASKRRSSPSIPPTTKPIPWRSASCSA